MPAGHTQRSFTGSTGKRTKSAAGTPIGMKWCLILMSLVALPDQRIIKTIELVSAANIRKYYRTDNFSVFFEHLNKNPLPHS